MVLSIITHFEIALFYLSAFVNYILVNQFLKEHFIIIYLSKQIFVDHTYKIGKI